MENERCEKHGVTRCLACKIIEAKKGKNPLTVPPLIVIPPPTKAGVPPPSITNAVPPDIEMMDAQEVNKAREVYDKEMEALLEAKARQEAINSSADVPAEVGMSQPSLRAEANVGPEHNYVAIAGFETLPVDDSHASKVVRAASEYAAAARDYALKLASYTKVTEGVKKAAEKLTEAALIRDKAEKELQALVVGGEK